MAELSGGDELIAFGLEVWVEAAGHDRWHIESLQEGSTPAVDEGFPRRAPLLAGDGGKACDACDLLSVELAQPRYDHQDPAAVMSERAESLTRCGAGWPRAHLRSLLGAVFLRMGFSSNARRLGQDFSSS